MSNELVHSAKKGNLQAKERLYHNYSKAMYNLCIKLLGNIEDAQDVLQDSFIHAFDKLHQLKEGSMFGGWLKRIVVNKCLATLQKNGKYTTQEWDEGIEIVDDNEALPKNDYTPQQINEAIAALPNGCKQVFVLFILENYSHKEIATSLQMSESNSKTQYMYAKKLLRNYLTTQF